MGNKKVFYLMNNGEIEAKSTRVEHYWFSIAVFTSRFQKSQTLATKVKQKWQKSDCREWQTQNAETAQ